VDPNHPEYQCRMPDAAPASSAASTSRMIPAAPTPTPPDTRDGGGRVRGAHLRARASRTRRVAGICGASATTSAAGWCRQITPGSSHLARPSTSRAMVTDEVARAP
jgi:hypothetical protein